MNSLDIFGEITFNSISYLVNTVVISTWLVYYYIHTFFCSASLSSFYFLKHLVTFGEFIVLHH
jgi:hypothetical protein